MSKDLLPVPDPLEDLSVQAAHLIRKGLKESRDFVLRSQELLDAIRTKSVVQNGTSEAMGTLSAKLGEAEDIYVRIFALVRKDYGEDPEDMDRTDQLIDGFSG